MNGSNAFLYGVAFLFTLTLTVFLGRFIIPILKSRAEQPIYTEGPSWHISKSGTPTMGGLAFLLAITLTLLLCALFKLISGDKIGALSLLICVVYCVLNACVGILDDLTKLKHKHNAGLTARAKLIWQLAISIAFLVARKVLIGDGTTLSVSFLKIDLGIAYYFLALIILIGITNCANLTDGIDGLASSVAFAIGISLFYYSYGISENAIFISSALAAGALGFLTFNLHPARVFMGDTGSLFLGSLVGALAFELGSPMIAVACGAVYVIEGVSVILQVIFYKMTKKRLFKMAPIHHHLEKCGWDENRICIVAIILTLVFSSSVMLCAS